MLVYSNMTAKDAYEEIMFRAGNYRNGINVDYDTILNYLNLGVVEALSRTLPYKEWAYVGRQIVQHRTAVRADYIGAIRVLVSADGQSPYVEARYVAPKEYNQVVNWRQAQTWNRGHIDSPVYTIWADKVTSLTQVSPLAIYIYPNLEDVSGSAPSNLYYPTTNMGGLLEYYQIPPRITEDADILPIPYEYEELVILLALGKLLSNIGDIKVEELYKEIIAESDNIIDRYLEKRRTEKRELDAFQEPVVPEVPPQSEQGEANKELIADDGARIHR